MEILEEQLQKTIGKTISNIYLDWDDDLMDTLVIKFTDRKQLIIQNQKPEDTESFNIFPDKDLEHFKGAVIKDIEIFEDLNDEDVFNPQYDNLTLTTTKGKLNLEFSIKYKNDFDFSSLLMIYVAWSTF